MYRKIKIKNNILKFLNNKYNNNKRKKRGSIVNGTSITLTLLNHLCSLLSSISDPTLTQEMILYYQYRRIEDIEALVLFW